MNTLVSVIVPAYNVAAYIERCVSSILRQNHKQIQIIVVNDCSTDQTGELLMELSARDERIVVVEPEKNIGLHAARAYGLKYAKGNYIGFVDGDDWIAPEMYSALVNEIESRCADIVICGAVKAQNNGKTGRAKVAFKKLEVVDESILERFCNLEFGSGVIWNKLYQRALIMKYATQEWERTIDSGADYVVGFGCFSEAKRVVLVPEAYYFYLCREDSMSQLGNAAVNFTIVLSAYARACEVYRAMGEPSLQLLDRLYRKQIQFSSYAISQCQLCLFDPYRDELGWAVQLLAQVRPRAIYEGMNVGLMNPLHLEFKRTTFEQWKGLTFKLLTGLIRRCMRFLRQ
jgi:glycosyltransferase involved in cell wall biosynthesis